MIIKSMARKEPTFKQIIEYMSDIEKSDEQYNVYHNIFSHKLDDLEEEFLNNSKYTQKRKNGNYMYHEILSISKAQKISNEEQKKILREIAYEYAQRRAKNNLVFGTLHDDHESHLHYHLLISANEIGESKKTRLSKAQFDKLKKNMESNVLKKYPQLEQKIIINKTAEEKLSRKGAEQKRRTNKVPQRDVVISKLQDAFKCKTKEAFFKAIREANLELYVRGQSIGIKDVATGRKHRLKTLGLMTDFQELSDRIKLTDEVKTYTKAESGHTGKKTKNKQKPDNKSKIKQQQAKRLKDIDELRNKQSANNKDSKNHKKWVIKTLASWVRNKISSVLLRWRFKRKKIHIHHTKADGNINNNANNETTKQNNDISI